MKNQYGLLSKGDLFVILSIILLAAVSSLPYFLMPQKQTMLIVIANDEEVIYEKKLEGIQGSYEKTFVCETGQITFAFTQDEGVKVSFASCQDQLCIHAGYINKPGQILVCLPGKIYAEIKTQALEEDSLDATVR